MEISATCVLWVVAMVLQACGGNRGRADLEVAPVTTPALAAAGVDTSGPTTGAAEVSAAERVEAACRSIASGNAQVLDALAASGRAWKSPDGAPPSPPLGAREFPGCVGGREGGAWAIAVERGEVLPEGGPWTGRVQYEYAVAVMHVAPDGTSRRIVPLGLDGPRNARSGDTSAVPHIEQIADLDEDGRGDAIVRWTAFNGELGERWLEVYTAGAATLSRWPDGAMSITDIRDVDGDGRLDLLDDRAFGANDGSSVAPRPTIPAMVHVLAGGRLSTTDEAVRAHYHRSCGGKRVDLPALRGAGERSDLLRAATCAWLWGVPGPAIEAKLRAIADEDVVYGGPWNEAAKPPVTLTE